MKQISKNQQRKVMALHRKKERDAKGLFLVEGEKMLGELLRSAPESIHEIYAREAWFLKYNVQNEMPSYLVSEAELKRISTLKTPNQVLAVVQKPSVQYAEIDWKNELVLYLDDLQDPGNVGTILRIADWFGITCVLLSKNCVEVYNPKVIQASMGAFLRVKTLEMDLETILKKEKDLPVYGAVLEGEDIFKKKLSRSGILVIGNEGRGISDENLAKISNPISIPAHAKGGAESLNAAVATGIICALFRKDNQSQG